MALIGKTSIVDQETIYYTLARAKGDKYAVRAAIAQARQLKGLDLDQAAALAKAEEPELVEEIFAAAREVKEAIYGPRLVIFAPLYISNRCANDCIYCGFRAGNKIVERRTLNQDEIAAETRALIDEGHKRLLLVAGEAPGKAGLDYICESIRTIYATRNGKGEIRRVNVNIAPQDVDGFRRLQAEGIGTYQLFQETYHRETYNRVHPRGPKRHFDFRLEAMHRAMEAGIHDVGIGALFGLYDWRFELLAILQHAFSLEIEFGVGPHTISVPRLEDANGSLFADQPPAPVSDRDFLKLVAILRLAVPYTGIIMSTRETAEIRQQSFELGVSQISAGSRTDPGGYCKTAFVKDNRNGTNGQFRLADERPLDQVVRDIAAAGHIPSFCTACYRLGRTGQDFMDLAKPGEIRNHCSPNALSTFQEYLCDYASPETNLLGGKLLARLVAEDGLVARSLVEKVRAGERDVFV